MHKSQLDLEKEMINLGSERAQVSIKKNEDKSRAALNPYAKPVYRKLIQPLADRIKSDIETKSIGSRRAHLKLLKGMEYETVAYIVVRQTMNWMLSTNEQTNIRRLAAHIGKAIQTEQVMRQFDQVNPLEFYKMMEEMDRKCSTDLNYRSTVVKKLLKANQIKPIDWGIGNREEVGTYMVQCMSELGVLDIYRYKKRVNKKQILVTDVLLSPSMVDFIKSVKDFFSEANPYKMPCVEKPHRYTNLFDGGFHSDELKKIVGPAIIHGNKGGGDPSKILETINYLQEVPWKINDAILEVAKKMPAYGDMSDIVGNVDLIKPAKPLWLTEDVDVKNVSDERKAEFKAWKKKMREWSTQKKIRVQHATRMVTTIKIAEKFKDEKEIYFVYEADFRGRVYPRTIGVNPQGSDLQKAMLHFSISKPIKTEDAKKWFYIHGASKAGFDKATLEERVKWVDQHKDLILACADDPVNNEWWKDVDSPWQFLAWCFEFAEFERYGPNYFQSRLPISMDGSCNGIQNFSAAFRDEVGAKATNLMPGLKPEDVYGEVAKQCTIDLQAMPDDPKGFKKGWLAHGINRSIVKRSVMTLPYGSTMYSSADFILHDYVMEKLPKEFHKDDYPKASQFLAKVLWGSIAKVVIKAREAMDWLQSCSQPIIKAGHKIQWETPNGFVVNQDYRKKESYCKINCYAFGEMTIYARSKNSCPRQSKNGIAPNFIHSIDAAHMQRVVIRAKSEGIDCMAMIHDDFGTHAADAEFFNKIIREEFVKMYEEDDWFERFRKRYEELGVELPEKPSTGKFDIRKVLESKYFFC